MSDSIKRYYDDLEDEKYSIIMDKMMGKIKVLIEETNKDVKNAL